MTEKNRNVVDLGANANDQHLMTLTSSAAKQVSALLEQEGKQDGALHIWVSVGGCSGLEYNMELKNKATDQDILIESQGARLTVDSESAKHLNGSELDYSNNLQNAGFKVTNPNATKTCSCGESFSAC